MRGVVAVAGIAEQNFFAALGNDAQGGVGHAELWRRRCRGAVEEQTGRTGHPICGDGAGETLNQLVAVDRCA